MENSNSGLGRGVAMDVEARVLGVRAGGKRREVVDGFVRGVCCEIAIVEGLKEA